MINYADQTIVRPTLIDGIGNWVWPATDSGAWIGPVDDWKRCHKPLINKYVTKRDVVVQAGGNCGLYPRLLSQMFDMVYTFEPDGFNFHCLVQNCQQPNIVKMQAALGHGRDRCNVQRVNMGNVGTHTIKIEQDGIVPVMMVDDLWLPALDLLMLDVEGHEEKVLMGATVLLATFKPVLFLENGAGNSHIEQLLAPYGYKYVENSASDAIYVAS